MIPNRLGLAVLVAGLSTLGPSAFAQSSDDIPPLLKLSIEASKKLRYSGVRRVQLRFGPDVVQHTEYVLKDGMRTRIWFPDEGSFRGQIIVETEGERRHYFPDKNQIEVMPPRREEHLGRLGKFGRQGPFRPEFRVEDGGQVANISTKKVEIMGPNSTVFMAIWLDARTGLVLKRVIYNKKGEQQASSEFTKVDYRPDIKRSDFDLTIRGAKVVTPRDRLAELVQRGGFLNVSLSPKDPLKLESVRIQRIDDVSALVQVYVKKDGRVSLFQLKAAINPDRLQRFGRGERLGVYSWHRGDYSFVLLGDMPENKLKELGQKLGG